jgi:hypothetical protein
MAESLCDIPRSGRTARPPPDWKEKTSVTAEIFSLAGEIRRAGEPQAATRRNGGRWHTVCSMDRYRGPEERDMQALASVCSRALLTALLIAWPGGQALQASDLEAMQQPQEARIYPHLRDPGVDEAEIRDMTIQSTILIAYFEDDAIESDRVNVKVDDGVVHLSGTVPSATALERAEGIAADTENVVSVVNALEVAEDA